MIEEVKRDGVWPCCHCGKDVNEGSTTYEVELDFSDIGATICENCFDRLLDEMKALFTK